MKKLKRSVAVSVSLIMALSLMPQMAMAAQTPEYTSAYESYFNGWTRWGDNAQLNGNDRFSCVTNEISHSGSKSVVLRNVDTSGNVKIIHDITLPTGKYTVSFWCAGAVTANDSQCVTLNGDNNLWVKYSMDGRTPAETDGDWSRYEFDIEVPEGKTGLSIAFFSDRNTEGWYIDDVCLVKEGTTKNLITNGSFEFSGTPTYTAAYDAYLAGWVKKHAGAAPDNNLRFTCVTNEIAHSGDHAVAIRHADSTKIGDNLIGVRQEVSPLEGATYTLSFWAVATGTNTSMLGVTFDGTNWEKTAINDFTKVETDGIWSKYSKDITVTDGNYKFTIFTDGETEGWYIDDISLVKQGTTTNLLVNGGFESDSLREEYTESYASYFAGWGDKRNEKTADKYLCVAGDVAHSGEHSLHMRHTDTENTNTIILSQNVALKPETYNISFWATGDYSLSNCKVVFYTPAAETEGGVKDVWVDPALEDFTQSATDGEWTKYEKTVSLEADVHVIRFTAENADTPSWYIDDISLTKQGTTKNILKNAGFELTEPEPDETTPAQDFPMSVLEGSTDANGNLSMAFVSDASIDPTEYKTVKFGFTKDGTTTYKGYALNKLISTKLTLGEGAFVGVCLMDIPAEYEGNVSMWLSNDTLVE